MHRVSSLMFGLGLALVAATSLSAQGLGGSAEGKAMKNPVATSATSVAAGQALYAKNCRFCHGPEAKGNGPMAPKDTHPSDLTDAKWDRGCETWTTLECVIDQLIHGKTQWIRSRHQL